MNIAKGKPHFITGNAIRMAAMLLMLCASSSHVQAQFGGGSDSKSALSKELQAVLKSHPDILAAQARVRLAEAELNQVKLRIAQEVVMLQNQLEPLEQTAKLLKSQFQAGQGSQADLMEAQTKLATLKAKKMLMLGSRKVIGPARVHKAEPSASAKEAPMAAMADKLRSALLAKTEISLNEQPIKDAVEFIGDFLKIPMYIDHPGFEENGDDLDSLTMTLSVSGVPLGAIIEAWEDRYPVRFVVRNYGILVTAKGSEADLKYMSALELWKQKKPAAKDKTKTEAVKEG